MSNNSGWGGPPGGGHPPPGGAPPPGGGGGWGQPPQGGGWGQPPGGPPAGGPPGGPPAGGPPGGPPGGWYTPPGGFGQPAPSPGMPPGYQPTGGGTPLEGGVPWESDHGSLLGRWWETMTAVNFNGRPFFTSAAQSDDAMSACMFSMTTGAIGGAVFGVLYMLIFAIWGTAVFAAMGTHKAGAAMAGMGIGFGILAWLSCVVMGCIGGFIGPWIGGGIHHLVLAMVGGVGEDKDYAHSVRVNAFAQSAAYLWAPIPGIGGLASLGFSAKNHIEGYDVTHGCGGGKAFLAWFSPVICCCCSYFFLAVMVGLAGGRP